MPTAVLSAGCLLYELWDYEMPLLLLDILSSNT